DFAELEGLHEDGLGLVLAADDLDHLIKIEISDEISAEHFQAMFDCCQPMAGAPQQYLAPVVQPFAQGFGKAEHLRDAALHQYIHVEWNATLELGEFEKRFHHQFGVNGPRARLDDQADILSRFIAYVRDQRQLLLVDQLGKLLHQTRFLHQPRNFADDDYVCAVACVFLLPSRAYAKRAAAGVVGFGDCFWAVDDDTPGREVRPLDVFEQRLAARFRIVDKNQGSVAQLGGIVRWDGGRHADRNALRTVRKQVRKCRRQHHGLFVGAVICCAKVDGIFVDAVNQ